MSKELAKTYDPKGIEERLYQKWMDNGYFHAKVKPDKKPFTIVMPPPNVLQRRLLPQKELLFLFLPLGYYQLLYEATKSKVQFPLPQIDMFFFVEHQIHRYRTKVEIGRASCRERV